MKGEWEKLVGTWKYTGTSWRVPSPSGGWVGIGYELSHTAEIRFLERGVMKVRHDGTCVARHAILDITKYDQAYTSPSGEVYPDCFLIEIKHKGLGSANGRTYTLTSSFYLAEDKLISRAWPVPIISDGVDPTDEPGMSYLNYFVRD